MSDLVRTYRLIIVLGATLLSACHLQRTVGPTNHMVFLGHIYQAGKENRIDQRLESVDFSQFEFILLGGDLCVETTKDQATLVYLDSIFNLAEKQTHWAVGNHDTRNGNLHWIHDQTLRPCTYYVDEGALRLIVVNTPATDCQVLEAQYDLLVEALQIPNGIKQVIIISHHAIWSDHLEAQGIMAHANAKHSIWRATCHADTATFSRALWPLLMKARSDGAEVTWISGDFGQKTSAFSYHTDGISFLGSGFAAGFTEHNDSVLMMNWRPVERSLDWQFMPVDSFTRKY